MMNDDTPHGNRSGPASPGGSPQRILVRGVNWLGDAVMTTPALLRLREAFPQGQLALLTPEKLVALWDRHPAIDRVISFAPGDPFWRVARTLREHPFDLALVLPSSFRSALEPWLARVPARVGYGGRGRSWLLTRCVPQRPGAVTMRKRSPSEIRRLLVGPRGHRSAPPSGPTVHHVHQYLHLVAALGANPAPLPPQLFLGPDERDQARATLLGTEPGGRDLPWLGLNPGAEYGPAKRWPAEQFIAVANEVSRRFPCRWVIFGGTRDLALADEIRQAVPSARNLAGRTSLRELMVTLSHCRCLLTNDTGPMHVAAALGTPVVALFGSTSPELTGPGLPGDPQHHRLRGQAPCTPCFLRDCPIDLRCLRSLTVDPVVQSVLAACQRH